MDEQTRAEQPTPTLSPESRPVMPVVLAGLEGYASGARPSLEALLREREARGLETHNGRNAMRSCAEGMADALMYATQAAMEQGAGGARWPQWLATVRHAALAVAGLMHMRQGEP